MSFNIFVSRFRGGGSSTFPAEEIRKRFGPIIVGERRGIWHLGFEEGGSWAEIHIPTEEFVEGFSVRRPAGYVAFWEIIAGFLKDLDCVLWWPGGGAVMARLDVMSHLPDSFIESMGIPWVTTDPEQIRDYVRGRTSSAAGA